MHIKAPHFLKFAAFFRLNRAVFRVIFPPPQAEVLPDGAFPPVHGAYLSDFINGAEKVFSKLNVI